MSDRDSLIGVVEVCELLAISRTTLERRVRSGRLPSPVQPEKGGHRKWKRSTIEALMVPRKRPSDMSKMTPVEREEYDLEWLWRGVRMMTSRGVDATPRELMTAAQRRKDDERRERDLAEHRAVWAERAKLPAWQEALRRDPDVMNRLPEWPALPSSRKVFIEQWKKGRRE